MLNHISWQQYITAVILLTAAWYAYAGLKFNLFKPKAVPVSPVPVPVMGTIQAEPAEEELIFGPSTPDEEKGPADDFIAEAQTLADAAETKTEFLCLLELLVTKYDQDELDFPALYPHLKLPYTVETDEWPNQIAA